MCGGYIEERHKTTIRLREGTFYVHKGCKRNFRRKLNREENKELYGR